MTTKKRWTEEEDNILVQAIKANPHNLSKVFKELYETSLSHRTYKAIQYRWYYVLNNPYNKKYVGCLFTTIGLRSRYDNKKVYNIKSNTEPVKHKVSIWNKIKSLLKIK